MRLVHLALPALLLAACSDMSPQEEAQWRGDTTTFAQAAPMEPAGGLAAFKDRGGAYKESAEEYREEAQSNREGQDAQAQVSPRLIRTGQISLSVQDYGPFEEGLQAWLSQAGGYVADTSLSHSEGEVSWATLTVRVPSDRFESLVSWAEESVEVSSLQVNTQDVTAEWVDVQARIDNGKRAESRLQELLATQTASLADVLEVERELSRVRGEIESAEGRMRVLRDQVGYSTLTLSVQVTQPWEPTVAPGFLADASEVFEDSVHAMGQVGRGLALLAVAASPWLTPPALLLLALAAILRRRQRRSAQPAAGPA